MDLPKERLIAIAVREVLKDDFKKAAPPPPPAQLLPQPVSLEERSPTDELLDAISDIVRYYYSIQDYRPAAKPGETLPPAMFTQMDDQGGFKLTFLPYPPEAVNGTKLDGKMLDADMDDELVRLFEDLEELDPRGIKLKINRQSFAYTIEAVDAMELLYLFEDLTLEHGYPTLDMLNFSGFLEDDEKTEEGVKCFKRHADYKKWDQYKAYVSEIIDRDRATAHGVADVDMDAFMESLPARPFVDFRDAERVSADYQSLDDRMPIIKASFARLENQLRREGDPKYQEFDDAPPLLHHH